jgi:hypothetical protein
MCTTLPVFSSLSPLLKRFVSGNRTPDIFMHPFFLLSKILVLMNVCRMKGQ